MTALTRQQQRELIARVLSLYRGVLVRQLCDGYARALDELDAAEVEAEEGDHLRQRMRALLDSTANALKGEPEPLSRHSWHDLPDVARALKAKLDAAEQRERELRAALRFEHEMSGCAFPRSCLCREPERDAQKEPPNGR